MPQLRVRTIPVFVVSLPDCTERRESISKALFNLGIKFEFIDAVDGRHGLDPQYEDQIDRTTTKQNGKILSDAEFACALSHLTVYQRIVSENIAYALILEDDAIPSLKLAEFLVECYYRDAELTQLYCPRAYVSRWGSYALLQHHTSYVRLPRVPVVGAVAYTVSYRAALHFVNHAVPITKEADWPRCIEALIKNRQCRAIYPPLVGHPIRHPGQSLLAHSERIYDKTSRRFFGVYFPTYRRMIESWSRTPYKLIGKRLP
ncbi:MAG: glycosyltransferase family 25 protein [Nitrospira sp. SB0662_bin_26]|nr:glycosyltransferase family 25 protein [Nitrospira sp. SB0662_bin_26]